MIRTLVLVAAVTAFLGCKKEAPKAKEAPAPAPSEAAPKPAEAPKSQTIVLDKLGLEADAPGCAELTTIDGSSQSITPKDPSCEVGFPGAVFTKDPSAAASLDDDLKNINAGSTPPEILRKETTATGWFIESKAGEDVTYTQRIKVADVVVTCLAQYKAGDTKGEVLKKICESARAKK